MTADGGKQILARLGQGEREIQLQRRRAGGEWSYELIANGVFIMASYNDLSSRLLVDYPLRELGLSRRPCRVLVGGLGLGYTVAAACGWDNIIAVDAVEINPNIIELNRTALTQLNQNCLADARVRIVEGDFFDFIAQGAAASYDLVCMDVDNGPMQLLLAQNSRVYSPGFFAGVRRLLAPGGVFIVWSCNPAPTVQADLQTAFGNGAQHVVWENHHGAQIGYYLYYSTK